MFSLILNTIYLLSSVSPLYPAQTQFRVETLASHQDRPWSLQRSGDDLYYTNRDSGELKRLKIPSLRAGKEAVTEILGRLNALRVEGEAGMLGLALDPGFPGNKKLYICYSSWDKSKPDNIVARFSLASGKLREEKEYLRTGGFTVHNGCRLAVSPDKRHLFITMGDNLNSASAQDPGSNSGKIHRLLLDGTIPPDNPFPHSSVWTYGHRNPQGIAFDPRTGKLWSTEHGPDTNDEINLIEKGKNYGWPECLGATNCGNPKFTPALRSYYPDRTIAPSNLIFYEGNLFPDWKGNILFVTLKTGRLYRLVLEGEKIAKDEILVDNDFGRLRDIAEDGNGALLIATESKILRLTPKQ